MDFAHQSDPRSEYYNNSHNGPWVIRTVFVREWRNKKTVSKQYGYVDLVTFRICHQLTLPLKRIEPFGWDSKDRTYIVPDDNRLYRRTDPPPPPPPAPKPKKNSKKAKAALRASKRRKVSDAAESEVEAEEETGAEDGTLENEDDGFGGMKWECVAVTLDELNAFVISIEKSRDSNEKALRKRIMEHLLPLLEKQDEARKRKAAQKERELLNLEKLATAKRSSRIAGKLEQQRQEEEAREAERKKQAELAMAKKEQEKWIKLEKERESRMMTREQRLKEREARRILHEEELASLSEDSKKFESGTGRLSERQLKAEIERKKQALQDLAEEADWIFDCICGAYGQIDDGTHSIACEKCNIWQHSKCVGVSQTEADREDFHFICKTCERRARDAERAKTHPPIKIKLNRPGSSSSPMPPKQNGSPAGPNQPVCLDIHQSPQKANQRSPAAATHPIQSTQSNGHQLAPWQLHLPPSQTKPVVPVPPPASTQNSGQNMMSQQMPLPYPTAVPNYRPQDGTSTIGSATTRHYSPYRNGGYPSQPPQGVQRPPSSHAFSPPHPYSPTNLPPPQPQTYSFVNGTPVQYNMARPSSVQATPSASNGYGVQPAHPPVNGQVSPRDGTHRRSSINIASPFSAAPVLTPLSKISPAASFPLSSSPPISSTPTAQPTAKFSIPYTASSPITQVPPAAPQNQDPNLPPASTGISPTKHSPPRPTTSNGSLGSATPSVLPPVTSLTPSPQLQNLTPPVKLSEPDRPRENGPSVAP